MLHENFPESCDFEVGRKISHPIDLMSHFTKSKNIQLLSPTSDFFENGIGNLKISHCSHRPQTFLKIRF